jgi:hypothetical protein
MKKMAAISAGCVILIAGLFLLFNNSSDEDAPIQELSPSQSPAKVEISQEAPIELPFADPTEPAADDDFPITKEQFESLSQADQNEILEEFVADFWQGELAAAEGLARDKKYISLDIFNRPYMQTITEREFFELSPEDQEKAMAETMKNLSDIRAHVMNDIIAKARESMANNDYLSTEANLIYGLGVGRELNADKDGLIITRLVGIACEKVALNEMVKLYTRAGDFSKVQIAQEQLRDIEMEVEDIRNTAKEFEANR